MIVLVAEDDASTRGMLSQYLKKKGLNVMTAADGDEAAEILKQNQISIAILDWMMPGLTGIDLAQKIRSEHGPGYTYILMLTARDKAEDMLTGFEAGVDEYIQKPINLRELFARIKVGMRIVNLEQAINEKQETLVDLIQIKNKFIGIAAHDLRNPVISIRGFAELIMQGKNNLNEEQKEFISIIHTTSDNMLALLNDLLDLSQIESGKLDISKTRTSLKSLVEEQVRLHRFHAEKKRITIHTKLKKLPLIEIDEQRIGQAIDNIMTNALKFSPPGTNVLLSLKKEGANAIFSVQDEGPGIPAEEQPLLFNEFQRLSIRPTGGESSTGLGLAITKRIIDTHGGRISVESHVGRGTTFSIILPF